MKINFNIGEYKNRLAKLDKSLIVIVYILVTISTIFIYSATRSAHYVKQILLWIFCGTIILFLSVFIDYRATKKYIFYLYTLAIVVLIAVRLVGKKTLGAQRWISIAGVQIQPSEFVKIITIMVLSYVIISKFRKGIKNLFDIIKVYLSILPIVALVLLQPDLGNTLIITFSYLCILFLNDANIKPLLVIGVIVILSAYPVYHFALDDYQKTRIEVFLNPEKDIKNKGWHVTQSKISIGSGEVFGTGIFHGSQSRLKFLPEPQTDFIFSVISEETGFLGSCFVIFLYFLLIFNMLKISRLIDDDYGRVIIYGVVGIFLGHTLINIGMTLGLVPVTGKTLLFLSYGGSSYLTAFMLIALVESVKMNSD